MEDVVPCEHQVAGWHNGTLSCVLKNKKGQILKPVKLNANPTYESSSMADNVNNEELIPVCRDELAFYELVTESTKLDDVALRSLIPEYYGCQEITKEDGQVIPHLVLQDLAYELLHPCVMDIKMGLSQDYPNKAKAPSKIKYATQTSHGFCLTGIRVFNPNNSQLVLDLRPDACKQLTTSEVLNALEVFGQQSSSMSKYVCEAVVEGLLKIRKWILEQRTYKIRRGSVLILYDASQVSALSSLASLSHEQAHKLKVTVKMIDFAHVFHACGGQDKNYLTGINSLIDFYCKDK